MALPDTKEALEKAGYVFDNEARCRGETCGAMIEWWIAPDNRKLPFTVVEVKAKSCETMKPFAPVVGYKRILHFIDCPDRKDFRKR